MNSSERRMKLILMLQQSNSRITVDAIAEKFDISRRTVFRDFNSLSEMNVPVTHDKYKGYGIMRGYNIPPLMFNTKELATILIGLNFVKSQVDKKLIEDAKGVELKFKEVVPDKLLDFMESLDERTVVDPYMNFGASKMEGGDWYKVSNAIAENNIIKFNYRAKSDGEQTTRKIDPYLIVFFRDHWNVIGHSHKRDSVRNFLLDRMSEIEVMDETFVPYGKIDVEQLIFRSNEDSPKVIVDVGKKALKRFKANLPANIFNIEEVSPNLFRVSFFFDNISFINKWLMQFPEDVEIVEPKELVAKRRGLLEKMMEQYK